MTTGERVVSLLAQGKSYSEIGLELGLSKDSVYRITKKIARGTPTTEVTAKAQPLARASTDDSHATVESPQSETITTLEALLEHAKVDRSVWDVERHVVNTWTLGNGSPAYQVKAWLVKIEGVETVQQLWDDAITDIRAKSPTVKRHLIVDRAKSDGHLFEITLPDLHIGKLSWADETGDNYDSKIAVERAKSAVSDLIEQAKSYPIERSLFLFGNDFLHYDNLIGTTTAGTPQDRDSRYHKMVRTGRQLATWIVDQLAEIAPVQVMVMPGNHDRATTWNLGEMLDAWYHNDERVTVDNDPLPRKYHRYGTTMLGFAHGDETPLAKLPLIMPVEKPEMWARTRYREWHVGHFHTSKVSQSTPVNSTNGVRVRVLQSLSGTDNWHSHMGYVGESGAAEAFIWSKDRGLRANLISNRVAEKAA